MAFEFNLNFNRLKAGDLRQQANIIDRYALNFYVLIQQLENFENIW